MSKAEALLNWWIPNNVIKVPSDAKETSAWAYRLAQTFVSAAIQLGVDKNDPVLDRERLYQRMIDAIKLAKSGDVDVAGAGH